MFLPFYFVNSKHTSQEQISDNSFSSFSRGVVNSLKVERNKYCCVTFSEIKQMAISPTTTAVFFILLCYGGRNVKRTLRSKSVRTPIVVNFTTVEVQTLLSRSVRNFLSFSLLQYFSEIGFLYLILRLPLLQIATFFNISHFSCYITFANVFLLVKNEWLTS